MSHHETKLESTQLLQHDLDDAFAMYKRTESDGSVSYAAGYPGYPENFSRDTLYSGIIAGDDNLLSSQLEASSIHQGKVDNPISGEKPGRIHHQFPGNKVPARDGVTTYNACDTSALYLIGAEQLKLSEMETADTLSQKYRQHILKATEHLIDSIDPDTNLFMESPPEGADSMNLRVTYWKDSILPRTDGKLEPKYPVTYGLAHFIAARALLSASRLLDEKQLEVVSHSLFQTGIQTFITPEDYLVYRDAEDELRQPSSDELHALAFIPPEYADRLPIQQIRKRAEELATPYGFVCTPPEIGERLPDKYHGNTVWVFEQAIIHYGAQKFGLEDEAGTAASVNELIGDGQELFGFLNGKPVPQGNANQLWSVAAKIYFAEKTLLSRTPWL